MNKFLKPLVIVCVLSLVGSSVALAETMLTKSDAKSQAVEICQTEAKKRYGDDSIKSIGKYAKWQDGMNGAAVKMKIKPQSKRLSKYSCVLQTNNLIKFYKA